jgi:competence protein ComEC
VRKLAVTACFFSAAIFVSEYLMPFAVQLWAGMMLLLFFIAALFIKRIKIIRFITLGLAFGLLWNYTYVQFSPQAASVRRLVKNDGSTQTVTAEVLSYPEETDYGKSVLIRAERAVCRLYIYGEDYTDLAAGDEIRVSARFSRTDIKTGSDYYNSVGIPLFAYAEEKPELIGKAPFSLRFVPAKAAYALGKQIDRVCMSAAPFIKAIITGDRSSLRENTLIYSLMNVTGIVHCVSVSGMHVSFLTGLIYFLLGRKRLASLICIPTVFFFMAMTGFSAAVVRAGIMQLAVCGASLTRREYDGKTALFLSLMLLLMINPCSAQNAGLQLSFGATLGILLLNERLSGALYEKLGTLVKTKILGKAVKWLISTLSVSLCALLFTVPLTAVIFERVSLIAPLTNLLTLWAVSFCFIIGLLASIISFLWLPLGSVIVFPALILVKYIYLILAALGSIPFASVYTGSVYIRFWLIFIYALLAWFIISGKQKNKAAAYTSAVIASLIIALAFGLTEANMDDLRFTSLDVGQGQCLVVTSKYCTAVIDCGGSSSRNAGDLAAEYLSSMGRTVVDCLILTHYHEDHAGGANELMRRLRVKRIIAPASTEDIAADIASRATERGTEITPVSSGDYSFEVSGLRFYIVPPLGDSGENEVCMCILVSCASFDALVTGDINSESELRLLEHIKLPDTELLIAGHHGSKYSTSSDLLDCINPEAVIISVGHNTYGHPSDELLDRLKNVKVYRTDEFGDITVSYNR